MRSWRAASPACRRWRVRAEHVRPDRRRARGRRAHCRPSRWYLDPDPPKDRPPTSQAAPVLLGIHRCVYGDRRHHVPAARPRGLISPGVVATSRAAPRPSQNGAEVVIEPLERREPQNLPARSRERLVHIIRRAKSGPDPVRSQSLVNAHVVSNPPRCPRGSGGSPSTGDAADLPGAEQLEPWQDIVGDDRVDQVAAGSAVASAGLRHVPVVRTRSSRRIPRGRSPRGRSAGAGRSSACPRGSAGGAGAARHAHERLDGEEPDDAMSSVPPATDRSAPVPQSTSSTREPGRSARARSTRARCRARRRPRACELDGLPCGRREHLGPPLHAWRLLVRPPLSRGR